MVRSIQIKTNCPFCLIVISLTLALLPMLFFVHIFEITSHTKTNNNCGYGEPIDVVYTWINGSDPKFLDDLDLFFKVKKGSVDSSPARFSDKNELRFSLRSLEKYASWVNHVYIVTNGQIPYWLNLDYEKVTIITHEEIFTEKFNLPTFSSPAIECNLHKIPGLSKRFIYFNDDIFLGLPTYLEDFYSPNKGFLLYFAWAVPQCSPNCPWVYVNDGQCDKACDNFNCQNDGFDCLVVNVTTNGINTDESVLDNVVFNKNMLENIKSIKDHVRDTFKPTISSTFHQSNKSSATDRRTGRKLIMKMISNSSSTVNDVSDIVKQYNNRVLHRNRKERKSKQYLTHNPSYTTLDAYGESLQHTNRMLNTKYGFSIRKMPSHAPILLDKEIMEDLIATFAEEFTITEKNRFRRADDVQFSFSYYYYVISEKIQRDVGEIFDEFDTDFSGTWSDREIRNILTRLHKLPLSYDIVDEFEEKLLNCSKNYPFSDITTPLYERYIDSRLKTVSKELVRNCPPIQALLEQKFGKVPKYPYEIVKNSESRYVAFKMLMSNISQVVGELDEIRSKMKNFVCLNDNLDYSRTSENELVKAILYDFYLSLFPHPSKFELPEDSRNRFMRIDELNEWRHHHIRINMVLCLVIFLLLCWMFIGVIKRVCCQVFNKVCC